MLKALAYIALFVTSVHIMLDGFAAFGAGATSGANYITIGTYTVGGDQVVS